MKSKAKYVPVGRRVMDRAWLRDESNVVHYGEELLLAALLHVKAGGRESKEMADIRRIMRDPNLED